MRKGLFPIIAAAFLLTSFSVMKKKKFIPEGTVRVTENFFAGKCEVTNGQWNEYEKAMITKYGKGSKEHLACLPDTLVWRDQKAYNEPYVDYYYRHPAYKEYPVVGISHEQALDFCKWMTERAKLQNRKQNIEYRLPSKQEWELLAAAGPDIIANQGKNAQGKMALNCLHDDDSLPFSGNADVSAYVRSYYQNKLGMYNLFGNVAEMLAEKGICKGGSWYHRLDDCRANHDLAYQKPASWLGLRFVCSIR